MSESKIVISGARANNLKDVSLEIPHHQLIVVTGVSGSGKSSLAFDVIAREGQRRYFETIPSFARQFMGKLSQSEVDEMEGISPVIAIGQKTTGGHARSTVGTMSDIYDLLRLVFARAGESKEITELSRSLFSFNSALGQCPTCKGIGNQEQIDLDKLVTEPEKTIREGALAPTLPTGYIMYSQVTIDALNQVCEAEGFDVDIAWNQLTDAQKNVILYGSEKVKVPFGKHSLESRLKWTGIKAKPREEGFYKGMIPIMSDILRRDRNANILKYVSSVICESCNGTRLSQDALSVHVNGKNIAEFSELTLSDLMIEMETLDWKSEIFPVITKIKEKAGLLTDLGLGHLKLSCSAAKLSASEAQRIRVTNQLTAQLSDVLYVLDEPSIGLHPAENERMIHHLKSLVQKGNTVIVVEHDPETIRSADWIIEMGPEAGVAGGEVLFNGSLKKFLDASELREISPTYRALTEPFSSVQKSIELTDDSVFHLKGCHAGNLKDIDVDIKIGGVNVVSGRSGSGTVPLVLGTIKKLVETQISGMSTESITAKEYWGDASFDQCIFVDQSPIGKTPRSNPATYLGISDGIRDLFASLPDSKSKGYTKSRFSFNNKGGRCETCQGAGKTQLGMHFLGKVDLICGTCGGKRFNPETLEIKYREHSIADVYQLTVNQAISFFGEEQSKLAKKILKGLETLQSIGLGYLTLGQSSTTLSGGEAQRVKIANQLQKRSSGNTLYILVEPSIGLHHSNISSLLEMFDHIKGNGNTIVCIEQDEYVISGCDWHIELGPKGGEDGGRIIYQGVPRSMDANVVREWEKNEQKVSETIDLEGVTTNGLKDIDVSIPKNQLTVVTGRSGSGKSSLIYDTLFAEANARFMESMSAYNRSFIQQNSRAEVEQVNGLGAAIALNRRSGNTSSRSTVGTASGIYDAFRLLYARLSAEEGKQLTAQHYSFNHHLGACETCNGAGVELKCDPQKVVVNPTGNVLDGSAFSENKSLKYYTNPDGQFVATLVTIMNEKGWNLNLPWDQLTTEQQELILYGTGEAEWEVEWTFKTKSRSGTQSLTAKWLGFCGYIDDEFDRKRNNKKTESLEALLHQKECETCGGSRLKDYLLETRFLDKNIHELSQLSIREVLKHFENKITDARIQAIADVVLPGVIRTLKTLEKLGLSYLSVHRPIYSLSGGEYQRVMVAGQLSSHLYGVTYVLDEPTIGLDEQQVLALISLLKSLIDKGNTVVVIEHDETFIRHADHILEMGPGSGEFGGEVQFSGSIDEVLNAKDSVTAKLLKTSMSYSAKQQKSDGEKFGVRGAFLHNLKSIDVSFVEGQITALTGVSGSGKSSLMEGVLFASSQANQAVGCQQIFGMAAFDEVLLVDQQPLSTSLTSTVVSYTGILDDLKLIFSKIEGTKELGLKRADFSYLSKNGKCPTCGGHGKIKTSLDFMSDVWTPCDTCKGSRYSEQVNGVRYEEKSIGDVLSLSIDQAINLFENETFVSRLRTLSAVGIGHVRLGQATATLSGGEAQRVKLSKYLLLKQKGKRLFLFDEPSSGLHYFDIQQLMDVFRNCINQGDTIIYIEHNKSMLQLADQVITLGPGSGDQGGEIVE